jgi:hypothetical protein
LGERPMKNNMDYTGAKLLVLDDNKNIVLNKPLMKVPLSEKYYEIESEKMFGKKSPCILERRRIEYGVCAEATPKFESGKYYSFSEASWFFDLYNLNGEYIVLTY